MQLRYFAGNLIHAKDVKGNGISHTVSFRALRVE